MKNINNYIHFMDVIESLQIDDKNKYYINADIWNELLIPDIDYLYWKANKCVHDITQMDKIEFKNNNKTYDLLIWNRKNNEYS